MTSTLYGEVLSVTAVAEETAVEYRYYLSRGMTVPPVSATVTVKVGVVSLFGLVVLFVMALGAVGAVSSMPVICAEPKYIICEVCLRNFETQILSVV